MEKRMSTPFHDHPSDESLPPETRPPYDPELHFLETLEREVARSAERAARANHGRASKGPTTQPPARRPGAEHGWHVRDTGRRIARRSVTLVALACLIGASAFGAREALSGSGASQIAPHRGAFALVARGGSAESWTLRAYRLGSALCRALVVAGNQGSRCAPPPAARGLSVTDVLGPQRQYVVGVAGRRIAAIAVRSSGAVRLIHTFTLDRAVARRGGLPARTRYFVAILPRLIARADPPVRVRALDDRQRPIGAPLTVCVENTEPSQCTN
jgi:hypothetical protein